MKQKYINTKILLACLAKKPGVQRDIHAQLQETIAEHKRIMQQLAQLFSQELEDEFTMQYKMAA